MEKFRINLKDIYNMDESRFKIGPKELSIPTFIRSFKPNLVVKSG
jgi:hypothetical protein